MEPNTDDQIEGQRIIATREITDAELEREDRSARRGDSPPGIELESGTLLSPSMDPEGIGPDNEVFFLAPKSSQI